MTETNESRVIRVPVMAKCNYCGSERKIDHASPPVLIGKKVFQYIPAHTCPSCNKGYHTTFYEDIAKEISNISRRISIKYAVLTSIVLSPISFILGIIFQLIFAL